MLKKIVFQPGINKEGTNYSAEGGWYDSDKIRFRKGRPEKIGGWIEESPDTFLGICRKLHNWMSLDGENYLALGTSSKVYAEYGANYYDITPSYDYSTNQTGPSVLVETLSTVGTEAKITKGDVDAKGWKIGDAARISTPLSASYAANEAEYVVVTGLPSPTTYDKLTIGRDEFDSTAREHYYNSSTKKSSTLERIPKAEVTVGDPTTATTGSPVGVMNGSQYVLIRQDSHGCIKDDYVTFLQLGAAIASGAGSLADSDLTSSSGFRVSRLLDSVNYEIDIGATAGAKISGLLDGTLTADIPTTTDPIDVSGTWSGTNFWIKIDDEYIKVGSASGTTLSSLTRGEFGSIASVHYSGAAVKQVKFICAHDINTGPAVYTEAAGWGRSSFGSGSFGELVVGEAGTGTGFRIWSIDNYGEDLVICPRDGRPYYWDTSDKKDVDTGIPYTSPASASVDTITVGVPLSQAMPLSSIGTSVDRGYSFSNDDILAESHVPEKVRRMIVYPASRQLIAFGCNNRGGTFDPMLIRWSSDGLPGSWDPLDIGNPGTTGFAHLNNGSEIITAARSKMEMLVWTDTAVFKMDYTPRGTSLFSISELATGISITGPLTYSVTGDQVFWMGDRNFYVYNGSISTLPCTVLDYVFSDLNYSQRQMFFAAANPEFNEVFFFYCSSSSTDIDRYVTYNYEENVWAIGAMDRTAWSDSGLRENPIAARIIDPDANTSKLYQHETGTNDVEKTDGTEKAMTAFIESAYFDIDEGDHFSFISRIIPDVQFTTGGGSSSNDMTIEVKKKDFPNDAEESSPSSSAVTSTTTQDYIRVRGRQAAVKFYTDETDVGWRLGDSRIDIRQDGRR